MKIKLAYTLALFALPVLANTPPEITNVRASQRTDTKLVDIYYDAADADGDLLKVRIEISDNDGVKYSVPAFSLTGDIGEGIAAGKDKHIVWDAGTDWDGEYSDQMRVKVYAIDAQGFPGLEWGNEVPPGGFLLGQDGGAEGSGPSRHVNIPWSFWLSKYEITCQQYCDFLNAALVSGFVARNGTTQVDTVPGALPGINSANIMLKIGDAQCIRWNVNNFEPVPSKTNMPVIVSWYGALAFCRYYKYDLPTEAEWEKAARGPDCDDQDEHTIYPWGNELSGSCANYQGSGDPYECGTTPVGYYNGNQTPVGADMMNGYGLYDVIGNVSEWTRSIYDNAAYPVEGYPTVENLDEPRHGVKEYVSYVTKGGDYRAGNTYDDWNRLKTYFRYGMYLTSTCSDYHVYSGFRAVRRSKTDLSQARLAGTLDCESLSAGMLNEIVFDGGSLSVTSGVVKCVVESSQSNTNSYLSSVINSQYVGSSAYLALRINNKRLRYIKFRMLASTDPTYACIKLVSVLPNGNESVTQAVGAGNSWCTRSLIAHEDAESCYLILFSRDGYSYNVSIDDLEFYVTED